MKYVAHFRFPDGVHIPAWQQHKFRVAKSPQALNNLFFSRRLLCAEAEMTPSSGVRMVKIRSDSLYRVSFNTSPDITIVSICIFSCPSSVPGNVKRKINDYSGSV